MSGFTSVHNCKLLEINLSMSFEVFVPEVENMYGFVSIVTRKYLQTFEMRVNCINLSYKKK